MHNPRFHSAGSGPWQDASQICIVFMGHPSIVDAVLLLRDTRINLHVFLQMLDVVMFGSIEHSQYSIPNLQFTPSLFKKQAMMEWVRLDAQLGSMLNLCRYAPSDFQADLAGTASGPIRLGSGAVARYTIRRQRDEWRAFEFEPRSC